MENWISQQGKHFALRDKSEKHFSIKKKKKQQTIAWEEAMLFTPTSRHGAELGRGGVSSEAALCFKRPPRRVLAGVLILTHHAGSQQP